MNFTQDNDNRCYRFVGNKAKLLRQIFKIKHPFWPILDHYVYIPHYENGRITKFSVASIVD